MRRIIRHLLFLTVCLLFTGFLAFEALAAATKPDIAKLPPLHNGDLIFQTNPDLQSMAVMMASSTMYTHVGILKLGRDGTAVVVEVGPVRETPLQVFIDRGIGKWIDVRRIKDLKPDDAQKALAWAKKQYGKPYDFFFLNNTKRFYCSELVEDAYKDGAGLSLGKYQKISELTHSAAMDHLIQQRWRDYPLCQNDPEMTYDKCYQVIMKQELITPASLAHDPRLEAVYSNYP